MTIKKLWKIMTHFWFIHVWFLSPWREALERSHVYISSSLSLFDPMVRSVTLTLGIPLNIEAWLSKKKGIHKKKREIFLQRRHVVPLTQVVRTSCVGNFYPLRRPSGCFATALPPLHLILSPNNMNQIKKHPPTYNLLVLLHSPMPYTIE